MGILAIRLASFVISIVALTLFIWSLRQELMDPDPAAAKEIFYAGEIGRTEDAGAIDRAQQDLQRSVAQNQAIHIEDANKQTLAARIAADQSSALPPFVFL